MSVGGIRCFGFDVVEIGGESIEPGSPGFGSNVVLLRPWCHVIAKRRELRCVRVGVLGGAILCEDILGIVAHREIHGWFGIVRVFGPGLLCGRHERRAAGERLSSLVVFDGCHVEGGVGVQDVVVERQVFVSFGETFMPMQGGLRLI